LPWRKSFDTISYVPPTTAAVASSPKLLDRVRWHLRIKHYSIRIEQAYIDWIRRYILFHRKRHPNEMGGERNHRISHSSRGRKRRRFVLSAIAGVGINFSIGLGPQGIFGAVLGIAILYAVLHIGGERKAWPRLQ
jgi:Phage integrase, N-terminal SAM-like domain